MWLAVSPLMAAGVVGAHALAYRVTGTPAAPLHHYLEHVPQILSVLAVAGLALGGLASRLRAPAAWPFPAAALATFIVQEHVERLAHTGEVPWLLGSRVFLVGLLLQVPVAVVVWAFARSLLAAIGGAEARRAHLSGGFVEMVVPPAIAVRSVAGIVPRGRGPPSLQTS